MNYKEIEWCGFHWRTQERWGDRHQRHPKCVRDGKMIQLNKDGSIALHVSKNKEGSYSAGMLSMIDELGYGTYTLEVKLPKGDKLWPSFWLYSYDSWPPEIDIFEGYSERDNYGKGKLVHQLRPNVHYGDNQDNEVAKGSTSTLSVITSVNDWNTYKLVYKKNYIAIYYNNIPVYLVTSKKIMKWFNNHEKMNVIINTGVADDYCDDDLKTISEPMLIRNFKYVSK